MYRKKLMQACLAGALVATIGTSANVPVVKAAAETQTVSETDDAEDVEESEEVEDTEEEEAVACLDYLRNQVILVKPKIIVLLGSTALKNICGKDYSITSARGKWIEKRGIIYMPTWHPAALLRDENKKIEFWKDLKEVMRKYKEIVS